MVTLQMFTGTLRGFFCNICRENPVILTDCRGIAGKICNYYRVFSVDIEENPGRVPVNPCKHLQCRLSFWVKIVVILWVIIYVHSNLNWKFRIWLLIPLVTLRFQVLLDLQAFLPKTSPFLICPGDCAEHLLQVFIVLGIYNFGRRKAAHSYRIKINYAI